MHASFHILAIAVFLTFPESSAAAASADRLTNAGYEIPAYGRDTEIIDLYSKPNGGLVLGFLYRGGGEKLFDDFYDVDRGVRLAPSQASEIANSYAVQSAVINANGLRRLNPAGPWPLLLPDGTAVEVDYFKLGQCNVPYNRILTLTPNGAGYVKSRKNIPQDAPKIEWMIFDKFTVPHAREQSPDCGDTETFPMTGLPPSASRYRSMDMRLYPDGRDGFYALLTESRYLIHFDASGRSLFFRCHPELVLLPARDVIDIFNNAHHGTQASQRLFFTQLEAQLDIALDRQKGNSKCPR